MHVGSGVIFQNPGDRLTDREVYERDLSLALQLEDLGFQSIWSVEHHFTRYTMCPDVIQFLGYMAGATRRVKLGSMVCEEAERSMKLFAREVMPELVNVEGEREF